MSAVDSSDLPDEFFVELRNVASRLDCDPVDLLAVMRSESDIRPAAHNPHGGASGLIQFMPSTLRGLGWPATPEAFRALSAVEQLPYVEAYFRPHRGRLVNMTACYLATFTPAFLSHGTEPSWVIAGVTGPHADIYASNRGFDVHHRGEIRISDLTERLRTVMAGPRWNDAVARLGGEAAPVCG